MPVTVTRLSVTAVKGTRLRELDSVRLEQEGVRGNRRFYVIDERDRMVNAKNLGELQTIVSDYWDEDRRLRLTFPGGLVVEGEIVLGDVVQTRFFSRTVSARLVEGPWSAALTEHVGRRLRLVEPVERPGVDRGSAGAVSLVSRGSLDELARQANTPAVDPRRFRMLLEVEGLAPHEEDGWVGRRARVGEAYVRFLGHVGRCLITSRDPETGEVNLPTLDVLGEYRRQVEATEPLPFGVYGSVLEPGTVRVGDLVELDAPSSGESAAAA